MADALGIIGVIGVAGQIFQLTVKFGLDWKVAPEDAKSFLKELQSLRTVLSETHSNILVDEDFKAAFEGRRSALLAEFGDPTQSTSTSSLINTCKLQLEDVLFDLKKRLDGHRLGWDRLKGAFTAKKTRETVEDLQRRCLSLNSLISLDALSLGVQTFKEVKQARQEQNDWQNEQRSREILDWLSMDDYGAQQSDLLRRRQAGTGRWLLDSSEYQNWVATPQTTLFCPGIPGAGKTMLTSIVVEDLQNRINEDENASMAYLYCNFRRQQEQTVEHLLSSILRQLAQGQLSLPECVRSLRNKHRMDIKPSLEQLSTTLRVLIDSIPKVYIIVDALDECKPSDGIRTKFLDTIFNLQSTSQANIFATSRYITEITDRFSGGTCIEIRAHEEDVRRYLEGKLSHLPACVAKSPDLQKEIVISIIRAVDGMFLLAQLHFDSLKGKRSAKAIRQALESLHTGSGAYDSAYDDAMKRITGQLDDEVVLAKQVLMWITCAIRPLTTFELQEALAVEPGESRLNPTNAPELEDIVSVCAGLVIVDEESDNVRLVHYTTQEYFLRHSDRWIPGAQCYIAETCVTYLLLDMFSDSPLSAENDRHDRLRPNTILCYAFEFWANHASLAESEPCNQLVSKFFRLRFFSGKYFGPNVFDLMADRLGGKFCFVGRNELADAASKCNFRQAQYLLQMGGRPNLFGWNWRTPLSSAISRGDTDIVRLLLDWDGVDVNAKDVDGRTPLHVAFEGRSYSMIDMLLDAKNIDLGISCQLGEAIIHTASLDGLEDVVRMFVRSDGNQVKVRDVDGRTPLHCAACQGHEAVVRILLDSEGIELNARDDQKETPLHKAAFKGHKAVTRMLLDVDGIEVNARSTGGWTPLHLAAATDTMSVAQMLLEADGVQVNARSNGGQTPLHTAACSGHVSVARVLLDAQGIEVNATNIDGSTPFFEAAKQGHTEMSKLLYNTGKINVNDENDAGRTPLVESVKNGHDEVVRFLLGVEGVGFDQTIGGGYTLLHLAAGLGLKTMTETLLASGRFDVNQTSNRRDTPLWVAAHFGKQATVEALLGVEEVVLSLDLKDEDGITAQSAAVRSGHQRIAELIQEAFEKHASSRGKATRLA